MKRLEGGIYLVLDPKKDPDLLLDKLAGALRGGLSVIQIWNHWPQGITPQQKANFIKRITTLARHFKVPVLMHEDWKLALHSDLDGVHFDDVPAAFETIKKALEKKYIGITVGNDKKRIAWAEKQQLSYISFCAMFPSSSVDTCEIVNRQTVIKARETTDLPIFLSGGIKLNNMHLLDRVPFRGVAVISGILDADDPEATTRQYLEKIHKLTPLRAKKLHS